MVRFLHTADWQLGMPFHWADGRADELRRAREAAVERLGDAAGKHEVDFVVVAGDVFDANTVSDRVVTRACHLLGQFDCPVFLLPGNHDFCGGPDSVYRRTAFRSQKPDNVVVLDAAEPRVVAEGRAVLLPAPLQKRHATKDPTRHLNDEFGGDAVPEGGGEVVRIGLAHGGLVDFSEGDGRNVIAADRAERGNLDYLALGDWHGCKQWDERTWYSGSPEPTSFKNNEQGKALVVEIDGAGASPTVDSIEVGCHRWVRHEVRLEEAADIDSLEAFFEELEEPHRTLVRLEYDGVLGMKDQSRVERLLETKADLLTHLRLRGEGIVPRPGDEEIAEMTSDGFVGRAVTRLKEEAQGEGPASERAGRALAMLYQIQTHNNMQGGQ